MISNQELLFRHLEQGIRVDFIQKFLHIFLTKVWGKVAANDYRAVHYQIQIPDRKCKM